MTHDWVKVGVEVVILPEYSSSQYGKTVKIAKIYKNGNFVLEDGTQQFSPHADGYGAGTGTEWRRPSCRLLTDDLREKVNASRALHAARLLLIDESERLRKLANSSNTLGIFSEAVRIKPA